MQRLIIRLVPWSVGILHPSSKNEHALQANAEKYHHAYVPFSSRNHEVSFTKVADDRRFHPVRDYLNSLPIWDVKKRIDDMGVV